MEYFDQEIEPINENFDDEIGGDGVIREEGYSADNTHRSNNYGQDPEGIEYLFQ